MRTFNWIETKTRSTKRSISTLSFPQFCFPSNHLFRSSYSEHFVPAEQNRPLLLNALKIQEEIGGRKERRFSQTANAIIVRVPTVWFIRLRQAQSFLQMSSSHFRFNPTLPLICDHLPPSLQFRSTIDVKSAVTKVVSGAALPTATGLLINQQGQAIVLAVRLIKQRDALVWEPRVEKYRNTYFHSNYIGVGTRKAHVRLPPRVLRN